MSSDVLVLNADMSPLHFVSIRHAIKMLVRNIAEVIETDGFFGAFPKPVVLRLISYVVTKWRFAKQPKWTRRGVMLRDSWTCCYCGKKATTIDHVTPRSLGGKNTWLNTVACCGRCNNLKGCRTLRESGMALLQQPYVPSWNDIVLQRKKV